MFEVVGPLPISGKAYGPPRTVEPQDAEAFWKKHAHLANRRGCYIIAKRAGKGSTPYYVGKTSRGFAKEALSDRNLVRYVNVMVQETAGTPVLFLLVEPRKRGRSNAKAIAEIEKHLISRAMDANPELMNQSSTKSPAWGIRGLIRSGRGKRSTSAHALRLCLSMDN